MYSGKKHGGVYRAPRDGGTTFLVVHYAGSVTYDVTGVIEKNRDTMPNSIVATLKSKRPFRPKAIPHFLKGIRLSTVLLN